MRRLLIWLLILGVLVGAVAAASVPAKIWWEQRTAPRFLTAKVSRGRVETMVNSTGTVKPVRTVSVGAFTSGPIKEVYVDYNTEITKKGQILALIDPKLLAAGVDRDRAAVAAQEADLFRLRSLLEQAERNEVRAIQLQKVNDDYISKTEMDQFKYTTITTKAQVQLAEASVQQAKAVLKNSEDNLNYTKIVAPDEIDPEKGIRGKVIERKVDPGQTVAASFQTPELFTIGLEMDKHMHVYASVDEADVGQIKAAMQANRLKPDQDRQRLAKFTVDAYPGELFEGDIYDIRLNSTTTQNVVTYPVIIDAPNRDQKLLPNMTANISFQIEAKEDVLRVPVAGLRFMPLSAQVRPEDRHYVEALPTTNSNETAPKHTANEKAEQARNRRQRIVWVQDGNLLRAISVTLGLMDNLYAEVIDGELTDGQVVVTGTESAFAPR